MLVVDLMHEFELGVWKALFIHLLRILCSVNAASLHELNYRYTHSFDRPPIHTQLEHCVVFGKYQHLVGIQSEDFDLMPLS